MSEANPLPHWNSIYSETLEFERIIASAYIAGTNVKRFLARAVNF